MKVPCYQHDSYDKRCSSCAEMNQPAKPMTTKDQQEVGMCRAEFEKYQDVKVTASVREGLWGFWQDCWAIASRAGAEAQRELLEEGKNLANNADDFISLTYRLQTEGKLREIGGATILALRDWKLRVMEYLRSAPIEGEKDAK